MVAMSSRSSRVVLVMYLRHTNARAPDANRLELFSFGSGCLTSRLATVDDRRRALADILRTGGDARSDRKTGRECRTNAHQRKKWNEKCPECKCSTTSGPWGDRALNSVHIAQSISNKPSRAAMQNDGKYRGDGE